MPNDQPADVAQKSFFQRMSSPFSSTHSDYCTMADSPPKGTANAPEKKNQLESNHRKSFPERIFNFLSRPTISQSYVAMGDNAVAANKNGSESTHSSQVDEQGRKHIPSARIMRKWGSSPNIECPQVTNQADSSTESQLTNSSISTHTNNEVLPADSSSVKDENPKTSSGLAKIYDALQTRVNSITQNYKRENEVPQRPSFVSSSSITIRQAFNSEELEASDLEFTYYRANTNDTLPISGPIPHKHHIKDPQN